ncbi:MATE family efflux transporter [Celeribacter neptunius]|uniref:Multidrug export protein MepA n=1 Tax=Celeribacter neptunius TaxID=588602 RepID=A0A1I3J2H6_9RHOB|nr:MATE family efflux transporter [Celeribacter neptunius]SFI54369.1 putative efflux protein, MATE family [Celeribacter neptunius]
MDQKTPVTQGDSSPDGMPVSNPFLTAPVTRLFIVNALPVVFMMVMQGLLSIVDAIFLGHFVGTRALSAVSVVFPILIVTIALSSLLGGGLSSLYARHLGAGNRHRAAQVMASAHGLAMFIALAINLLYAAIGPRLILTLAQGDAEIAAMAGTYTRLLMLATPVQFLLSLHSDGFRNEGKAPMIAVTAVAVTLANMLFDYVFVVPLGYGVAGVALGTILAQLIAVVALVVMRLHPEAMLRLPTLFAHPWHRGWGNVLKLGAPMSLSMIGLALSSAVVISALGATALTGYPEKAAAYGIVTRLYGFAFMPLMGLAMGMQSIVGNNVGARLYRRSDAVLRVALGLAFAYCLALELLFVGFGGALARIFTDDPVVIAYAALILRNVSLLFAVVGPTLALALYFQAIGAPGLTALLSLLKPYVIAPMLVISGALMFGEHAIWPAQAVADLVVLCVTLVLLRRLYVPGQPGFGIRVTTDREDARDMP